MKNVVLYIHISEDQNGKTKNHSIADMWNYYWENDVLFLKSVDGKSCLCFMAERITIAVIYVYVQIKTDLYINISHAVM